MGQGVARLDVGAVQALMNDGYLASDRDASGDISFDEFEKMMVNIIDMTRVAKTSP